jgi:hypothetical protein
VAWVEYVGLKCRVKLPGGSGRKGDRSPALMFSKVRFGHPATLILQRDLLIARATNV